MIYIEERGTAPLPLYYRTVIKQVINAGLGGGQDAEISISFVTPDEIRRLNYDFRQKDSATDVLSFPGVARGNARRRSRTFKPKPVLAGDIVICLEVAEKQATEIGHSLEREVAFLTAHGLLHLQGYDHETPEDEADMISRQKGILQSLCFETS
ncbi:MAG: rRNA maturation RNase YbeY [Defluviitaleaceae bacterium]|nr:rRNA maturation RNase YbeY [Defluviitaleaceae bacterium]